ncbi:hypothetical protein N7517_006883 [Penicillium concentricum]|uniref:SUZ domain-containing protein n=1 Tax=Penicillium concentricum TaxID=293559 RepID=A0A9W9VAJ2_9EURO|nr:uncharacterized protein N7517_006883 [Penicillium concentricum]KAJ5374877.1 hypothetical protein N7517_006883 [Penicillium concentricum]
MSANSGAVPDAWEDSWENQADTLDSKSTPPSEKKVSSKVTKAQRRAEQAEFNRQLWAEAESTETFHFVEARADVPLKQDFKPAVTLLSRKPQLVTRHSSSSRTITAAAAGLGRLGLDDDDDSDDDTKPPQPTPEERHAIALKNREEKQRKYEEVRERLFGSPSATASGTSSPGSTTPPRQTSTGEGRGRGKGRGGGRDHQKRDSSSTSSKSKHLYDPSTAAKSNAPSLQRGGRPQVERSGSDSQAPQQPVRSPRGPDASGRGGFNFNRGARTG